MVHKALVHQYFTAPFDTSIFLIICQQMWNPTHILKAQMLVQKLISADNTNVHSCLYFTICVTWRSFQLVFAQHQCCMEHQPHLNSMYQWYILEGASYFQLTVNNTNISHLSKPSEYLYCQKCQTLRWQLSTLVLSILNT